MQYDDNSCLAQLFQAVIHAFQFNKIHIKKYHRFWLKEIFVLFFRSPNIRVYNCTSGQLNTLDWETCRREVLKYSRIYPSKYVMMYPNFTYRTNRFMHFFYEIFLHFLPAYLFDFVLRYKGMKPIMFKIAKRYKMAADTGEFFAMHEYNFEVNNVKDLLQEISNAQDGDEFMSDVKQLNWDSYLKSYVIGIRKYILKDDDTTLERARRTLSRLVSKEIKRKYILIFIIITIALF